MEMLPESEWQERMSQHRARIEPLVAAHRRRASHGKRHPVIDFLFQYYSFSPAKLLEWHPGAGVGLGGSGAGRYLSDPAYTQAGNMVFADIGRFPERRREALGWVISLQEAIRDRPARFSCFGLHEWAMVYRSDQPRHGHLPLRMEPDALARFVEQSRLCCSHYDAFRFFTRAAKPMNAAHLDRGTQPEMEQGGCLHANMDLYKWAYKFHPWTGSELVADAFFLALRIREADMRASPYDISGLGYASIPIETEEGRAEYVRLQKGFAVEAEAVRDRLLDSLRPLAGKAAASAMI